MALLLSGKEVAKPLERRILADVTALAQQGVFPTLAIVRMGEHAADIAYERSASRHTQALGLRCTCFTLAADASQSQLLSLIRQLNEDSHIHGILLLRPLPKHIDDDAVRRVLAPEKDVDGITAGSLGGVFSGSATGFSPCTAQACVEILDHYGIDCSGKQAVVLGRSLVVGKPVAMLLLARNATVTICHTKTRNIPALTRMADIVVAAVGQRNSLNASYFSAGQIVIDVGIHWDPDTSSLCGDIQFEQVSPLVEAITPVPGGVGSVTTTLLALHVLEAAKQASG